MLILWILLSREKLDRSVESLKRDLQNVIADMDKKTKTQVGRLMVFYLRCAEETLNEKNGVLLNELIRDLQQFGIVWV